MTGRTCLVTGATSGLGRAVAAGLANLGADVLIIGRNPDKIDRTLDEINRQAGRTAASGIRADLSDLDQVRRAAENVLARCSQLDVLVNNVGATMLRYQKNAQGLEMTWALNYLGHFLLTHLLLGSLRQAALTNGESRVVEVTSSMSRFANPRFGHLQKERGYNGVLAYAQSKRAINLFSAELARREAKNGVMINAVSPGFVRTGIAAGNGPFAWVAMRVVELFSISVEEGALPLIHMAAASEMNGVTGQYFYRFKPMPYGRYSGSVEDANHLWTMSLRSVGLG